MNHLFKHQAVVRENLLYLIGMCLCLYFTYHAVQGNRSLVRMMTLKSQIETKQHERDNFLAERLALEERVSMMRPGSLNRDLLEERARAVLGYKSENEVVILRN